MPHTPGGNRQFLQRFQAAETVALRMSEELPPQTRLGPTRQEDLLRAIGQPEPS
jgi:hypothetical protein